MVYFSCCECTKRSVGLIARSMVTCIPAHHDGETGLRLINTKVPISLFYAPNFSLLRTPLQKHSCPYKWEPCYDTKLPMFNCPDAGKKRPPAGGQNHRGDGLPEDGKRPHYSMSAPGRFSTCLLILIPASSKPRLLNTPIETYTP